MPPAGNVRGRLPNRSIAFSLLLRFADERQRCMCVAACQTGVPLFSLLRRFADERQRYMFVAAGFAGAPQLIFLHRLADERQ